MRHAGSTGSALLIVDMISTWDFVDGDRLLPGALQVAPVIARLKRRCRTSQVPTIYANDNRGHWRSDFCRQVADAIGAGGDAACITRLLEPDDEDYFVLKPKQSAFHGTPLDLLLSQLGIGRLIVVGVASDQCVLTTAIDARMHDLECCIPRDAVASQDAVRNRRAIEHFERVAKLPTTPASRLKL